MKKTLIDQSVVKEAMDKFFIDDLNKASIRQMGGIVREIETSTGIEFLHLEIGVPGFAPEQIGVQAELEAHRKGLAAIYPPMEGIQELKRESSRFVKAFLDTDVSPDGCVPTVGSMQGSYAALQLCSQVDPKKDTILFVDPGFSVQKIQTRALGVRSEAFDLFNYRDSKLGPKLEEYMSRGNVAAIIYSNPNNPTWMCLSENELRTIGELATRYDVTVIEDMAYLAMDFRTELGIPYQAPYQPTVSRYTDNYILLISGSKIFSYAGQRIAMMVISDKLYHRNFAPLEERYAMAKFGPVMVQCILYCLSAGTSHTAQYAMAAMMGAANDGKFNFLEPLKEYGRRSERLKKIFERHGFNIIYDRDLDKPLSDGFFFTVGYKGMEGGKLLRSLLCCGVNAIVLSSTGSDQQGLRICSSAVKPHYFDLLEERLAMFVENNK